MADTRIDPAFIQAVEDRPKPTITEGEGIPVIDLSKINSIDHLSSVEDVESISDIVQQIGDACKKWGFFQVINHGVPLEKLEGLESAARAFFSLSEEEKKAAARDEINPMGYHDSEHTMHVRDWKQVFDFTGRDPTFTPAYPTDPEPSMLVNRWPQSLPEFREAGEAYAREMEKLGIKLVELIALSLGLKADRFNGFFKDHTGYIRINYYPPCPAPDLALGIIGHKDISALTILAQDDVSGLQVRRKSDGEWISVSPTHGAYTINIGDIMQVWTNEKYDSVEHRAVVNSEKERISIPFFFDPSHYVDVKPLEEMVDDQNPPRYRESNWGKFFAQARMSNFQKLDIEDIEFSHFRITPEEQVHNSSAAMKPKAALGRAWTQSQARSYGRVRSMPSRMVVPRLPRANMLVRGSPKLSVPIGTPVKSLAFGGVLF